MVETTSSECKIENNIFKHLRHSMILQAGANGNVFTYNYSTDPYWETSYSPPNSAGDVVLHGNYPYRNLFEGNVVQNIVIDNSHGSNGPYNTFLRNRAALYGIFMSADNSPSQNFLGNEIPLATPPYGLYLLQGVDHFEYGNNHRGVIIPSGTQQFDDSSYAFKSKPAFLLQSSWRGIGTPNAMNAHGNSATYRMARSVPFATTCGANIPPTVSFWKSEDTVHEIDGQIVVCIQIEWPDAARHLVHVSVDESQSSARIGDDFDLPSGTMTYSYRSLAMDDRPEVCTISVKQDSVAELRERIVLRLATENDGLQLGKDSVFVLTILESPVISVVTPTPPTTFRVDVFPNPAGDKLFLSTSEGMQGIEVYNMQGSCIAMYCMPDIKSTILPIEEIPPGIYFLRVITSAGVSATKKLYRQVR